MLEAVLRELDKDWATVLAALARRWTLVATVAVTGTAAAAAVLWSLPDRYDATALVLAEPGARHPLDTAPRPGRSSAEDQALVDSQMRLVTAPARLAEAHADVEGRAPTPDELDALARRIEARRQGASHVIAVTASAPDPAKAAGLANALVARHLAARADALAERAARAAASLRGRLREAERDLAGAEEALRRALSRREGATAIGRAMSAQDWPALAAYFDDPEFDRHIENWRRAHIIGSDRIPTLEQRLAAHAERLAGTVTAETGGAELAALYIRRQQAESARAAYDRLLSRAVALETEAQVPTADAGLVSAARPPARPAGPQRAAGLAAAALAALMTGAALAILAERRAATLAAPGEAARALGLPTAAAPPLLPRARTADHEQRGLADLAVHDPFAPLPEAWRALAARFGGGQVLLVTGCGPRAGASTTALGLARSAARAGRRTLLVDADLRRPALGEMMGVRPRLGLTDLLTDSACAEDFADAVVPDPLSPLTAILGAPGREPTPDTQFGSGALGALLAAASRRFELVVLDSASLRLATETALLAARADAALLVMRAGETRAAEAASTAATLAAALPETGWICPILNAARPGRRAAAIRPSVVPAAG